MPVLKPIRGIRLNKSHPLTRGLVGCWLFNEGSGNKVYDLSGNGNDAIEQQDSVWQAGKFGSSRYFSGNDYLVTAASDSLTCVSGTILVWFRTTNASYDWFLDLWVDVHNRMSFIINSAGSSMWLYGREGGATRINFNDGTAVNDGIYHQCVATWGVEGSRIYRDGVELANSLGTDHTLVWWGPPEMYIGLDGAQSAYFSTGNIDHVLLFNRALSASEIALLYREPFCMFERDPIELWSAATLGAIPTGMAGAMTTNTRYWGW